MSVGARAVHFKAVDFIGIAKTKFSILAFLYC